MELCSKNMFTRIIFWMCRNNFQSFVSEHVFYTLRLYGILTSYGGYYNGATKSYAELLID